MSNAVERVRTYLHNMKWCKRVVDVKIGQGLPRCFMSFLVKIEPAFDEVPEYHWVVLGDIPTAYISIDGNDDAWLAIDAYILVMEDWVQAVRRDQDVSACFPMPVPSTREYADMLSDRLQFMRACLSLDDAIPENLRKQFRSLPDKFMANTFDGAASHD